MQKIKSNYLPKAIFIFAMFDILDMKLVRHCLKVELTYTRYKFYVQNG